MAYITFDPSTAKLAKVLKSREEEVKLALQQLTKLGVKDSDIFPKFLNCNSRSPSEHFEVILKTDNPKVTARKVFDILNPIIGDIPFEITRIPVGYGVIEIVHECLAFVTKNRRNWASNYE